MATASPTLGNGTASSADAMSIHATIPTVSLTSVGDKVTLSGSATLAGIASSANQFRWALYDVNGSSDDTGWLGYIGSQGASTNGANLLERANPNTVWYMSGTGSANVTIDTATAPGTGFSDGTYDFSLTLELTASGIQIDSSIIRTSDSKQFGLHSVEDTTPQTTTFNRVAFLVGGVLDADQVQFSNIDVTYLPAAPDTTAPSLIGTSPADDASGIAVGTSLVATFDEPVVAGTGAITIKNTAGDVTVASFDVANSPAVSFVGANVTVNPPGDLDPLTDYHVIIDPTAVADGSGNAFAGISSASAWNFTTAAKLVVDNPGPRLFGIEFNRNDAFGSPSQSLFRIVGGSDTQADNATSYTKTIGARQVTISQPNSVNLEFRGANGDSTRAIPGGDTSRSFLVADFIATRAGAIDISITGLAAGDYLFRSDHLDTFTGAGLGFAQGATTTTPNTIEARIRGVVTAAVQPTCLGPAGLNTTFINDGQIPTLGFAFTHDGSSPLVIELRSTMSNGADNHLLLNGFELFQSNP